MARMTMVVPLLGAVLFAGCSFDTSGPSLFFPGDVGTYEGSPPPDGGRDARAPDGDVVPIADHGANDQLDVSGPDSMAVDALAFDSTADTGSGDTRVDTLSPDTTADTLSPDTTVDTQPPIVPITSAALGQALRAEMVDCLDNSGASAGAAIAVADDATAVFYDGAITLAGAVQETLTWVGGRSAVAVKYNLNSCGDEWVQGGDWGTAGLLVRGAQHVGGELILTPGTTAADIDLIDIAGDGTFQQTFDPCGADDSTLPPQLVQPVGAAKQVILRLGGI